MTRSHSKPMRGRDEKGKVRTGEQAVAEVVPVKHNWHGAGGEAGVRQSK